MLIMLIDHVRERFFLHHQVSDPMNIDLTSPGLFFTRLSAHLCAPIFVFLTGLSAWLYQHPATGQNRNVQAFLLKRGLLLIVLEATLINFSWFGAYHTLYLQVIWAIGISMLALAAMVSLPRTAIGLLGAIIVVGHNALTPISFIPGETGYWLWTILHDRGYLVEGGLINIRASYPVLPWIGVILLGYYAGSLFGAGIDYAKRRRWLLGLAAGCLTVLLLLRGFNIYGETQPWQPQATTVATVMDFFNFTKYPPSLHFLLLTLGIGFLLLILFERYSSRLTEVLRTFGSAPMFFYILHLYVLLVLYLVLLQLAGPNLGQHFGFSQLWMVWLTTFVLAIALYFPTRAFGRYKRVTRLGWVKYF